jgi:hypothetical protein
MDNYLSLADGSRRIGLAAHAISKGIFDGRIDPSTWPVVSGRRLVPASELENIRRILTTRRPRRKVEQQAAGV